MPPLRVSLAHDVRVTWGVPKVLFVFSKRSANPASQFIIAAPGHKKSHPKVTFYGRGDRIRTCDLLLPKQPRYQTALLPVEN